MRISLNQSWSWDQANMQERLRVAEIRAEDYKRYSEELEQQIITKEQAYRDLQDRHDRARGLVYRLIDELAAAKAE